MSKTQTLSSNGATNLKDGAELVVYFSAKANFNTVDEVIDYLENGMGGVVKDRSRLENGQETSLQVGRAELTIRLGNV